MNAPTPVRLCMIGAGWHSSKNIYPCFSMLNNAEVVANADLDEDRARATASRSGISKTYTDYQAMLEAEKPDGVIVCVGPDFHGTVAPELMEAGYHVYTEKPPATDLAQCKNVLDTQQRTGRICMTAFKKRFTPAYVKAKQLLDGGNYGEPVVIDILRTSGPYDSGDKYLLDSAIHVIDLASYLGGPVRTVSTVKGASATYAVSLDFAAAAVGNLTLTDRMNFKRGWEQTTVITSEGLCIQVDNSVEMLAFQDDQPIAAHKPEFVYGGSHSSEEMGFVGELQAFVDAITGGYIPESSINKSTHTMAVLEAIHKAVNTGLPANIDSPA